MKNIRLLIASTILSLGILSGCSWMKFWDSDQAETASEKSQSAEGMGAGKDGESAATTSDETAAKTMAPMDSAKEEDKEPAKEEPATSQESESADAESKDPAKGEDSESAETSQGKSDQPAQVEKEPETESSKTLPPAVDSMEQMSKPAAKVPLPKDANHFVISVGEKTPQHPFYNKGHKMGFSINNIPGGDIAIERGKTYKFEVVTNPLHDVYLSEKDMGWGSSAWTSGVEGQFIYSGVITFKPDSNTPDYLYYSCRNHPYMGGKIHVVNPGQTVKLAKRKASTSASVQKTVVTKNMVQQKHMFADMLVKSNGAKRIKSSDNAKAIKLLAGAEALLKSSQEDLKNGKLESAYADASKAVEDLKDATRMVPSQDELVELKEQYKEISASLADFEKSHKKSYDRVLKKQGKDAVTMYDKQKVEKLKKEAGAAVKDNDYAKANKLMQVAQREVTLAIKKMMDSQTVVYDLNFESAEEEYEYELRRFKGYEILIPIAIQAKKPNEGTQKLMESFANKGRDMRKEAIKKAKEKDFPTAIAMLLDATKQIRRALSLVGINQ